MLERMLTVFFESLAIINQNLYRICIAFLKLCKTKFFFSVFSLVLLRFLLVDCSVNSFVSTII